MIDTLEDALAETERQRIAKEVHYAETVRLGRVVKELREALASIKWRSADRDNMEFSALITYVQMDAIRSALAKTEAK